MPGPGTTISLPELGHEPRRIPRKRPRHPNPQLILHRTPSSRLVHSISPWGMRVAAVAIGGAIVLAAPLTLIDPLDFHDTLAKPSLVAPWLSRLIVFAEYPRFAINHGQRALPEWVLGLAASALALYGLWTTL